MLNNFFNPRKKSFLRGNILVLGSLAISLPLADFPNNRATLLLIIPAILAILGMVDTVRCIQRRWSLYHAGVLLCIYMDLMAISIILFFLLYPYADWLNHSHSP